MQEKSNTRAIALVGTAMIGRAGDERDCGSIPIPLEIVLISAIVAVCLGAGDRTVPAVAGNTMPGVGITPPTAWLPLGGRGWITRNDWELKKFSLSRHLFDLFINIGTVLHTIPVTVTH